MSMYDLQRAAVEAYERYYAIGQKLSHLQEAFDAAETDYHIACVSLVLYLQSQSGLLPAEERTV